jgi:hypothetical protein
MGRRHLILGRQLEVMGKHDESFDRTAILIRQ